MDKAALPLVERQRDLSITSGCAHAFLTSIRLEEPQCAVDFDTTVCLRGNQLLTIDLSHHDYCLSNQLHATSLTLCESHKRVEITARENANVLENTSEWNLQTNQCQNGSNTKKEINSVQLP